MVNLLWILTALFNLTALTLFLRKKEHINYDMVIVFIIGCCALAPFITFLIGLTWVHTLKEKR